MALATAANADVIVSGDRDLTTATGLEVQVLTPKLFLDRLQDPEGPPGSRRLTAVVLRPMP